MPDLGELAALATAVCWTGSSLFFALATRRTSGLAVNQFRLLAAMPCLSLLHRLLVGSWFPALDAARLGLLCASGLIGLVLGDIGYFHALKVIGPRIASVLMATWPMLAMATMWAWRGEQPTAATGLGVAMTTAGVMLVVLRQREGSAWQGAGPRGSVGWAIAGALGGALGQALGSVLVKVAAAAAPADAAALPGLSAALVRITAAAFGITLVALLQRRPAALRAVIVDAAARRTALLGTACGPVVGVWLSMIALSDADVGIAAALMATTPVFMMPVAKLAYGARIGVFGVLGTLLAVGGAAVLLLQMHTR